MYTIKCLECGKTDTAERRSKKFCSDLCRVSFNRGKKAKVDLANLKRLGVEASKAAVFFAQLASEVTNLIESSERKASK